MNGFRNPNAFRNVTSRPQTKGAARAAPRTRPVSPSVCLAQAWVCVRRRSACDRRGARTTRESPNRLRIADLVPWLTLDRFAPSPCTPRAAARRIAQPRPWRHRAGLHGRRHGLIHRQGRREERQGVRRRCSCGRPHRREELRGRRVGRPQSPADRRSPTADGHFLCYKVIPHELQSLWHELHHMSYGLKTITWPYRLKKQVPGLALCSSCHKLCSSCHKLCSSCGIHR